MQKNTHPRPILLVLDHSLCHYYKMDKNVTLMSKKDNTFRKWFQNAISVLFCCLTLLVVVFKLPNKDIALCNEMIIFHEELVTSHFHRTESAF